MDEVNQTILLRTHVDLPFYQSRFYAPIAHYRLQDLQTVWTSTELSSSSILLVIGWHVLQSLEWGMSQPLSQDAARFSSVCRLSSNNLRVIAYDV